MKHLFLTLVTLLVFTASYSQNDIGIGFGIQVSKESEVLKQITVKYDKVSLFLASNSFKGDGELSKRKIIPKKAVLLDKKCVSLFGFGYDIELNENSRFFITPSIGMQMEHNLYQGEQYYIKKSYSAKMYTGANIALQNNITFITLGFNTSNPFNFSFGFYL